MSKPKATKKTSNKLTRKLVILSRTFSHGLHNIVRNIWLTTAATVVMMVALAILLIAWILNMSLTETVDDRSKDFAVGIYLEDEADPVAITELRQEIEAKDYVSKVDFISKDRAREIFEEQFKEDEFVRQGLDLSDDNVLPASFDVRFDDLSKVPELIVLAESEKYAQVIYRTSDNQLRRASINQYLSIQNSVNKGAIIGVAVFGAIAMLVVFNTIRMAVFSRSREIEIMKLIGATPNYIRGPFLVEAALYGVIAGIIAFSAAYSVLKSVLPNISSLKSVETIQYFASNWLLVLVTVLVAGAAIGLVSSQLATTKYLRLKRW